MLGNLSIHLKFFHSVGVHLNKANHKNGHQDPMSCQKTQKILIQKPKYMAEERQRGQKEIERNSLIQEKIKEEIKEIKEKERSNM